MRDLQKKPDEEMLVVHRPPPGPEHHARLAVPPGAESLPANIDALVQRFHGANSGQRSRLLGVIQTRFGNDFAGRVVNAFRRQAPGRRESSGDGTKRGDKP